MQEVNQHSHQISGDVLKITNIPTIAINPNKISKNKIFRQNIISNIAVIKAKRRALPKFETPTIFIRRKRLMSRMKIHATTLKKTIFEEFFFEKNKAKKS